VGEVAQLMAGQDGSHAGHGRRRCVAAPAAAILALVMAGGVNAAAEEPHVVGGCQTEERDFGLPALRDSVAIRALEELTAPGEGPKMGPTCRALHVDAPLFVTIGAVAAPPDSLWALVATRVTERMQRCAIRPATRSLLRVTRGPCFPPHHVEFEAVGDSVQVEEFLKEMSSEPWDPMIITTRRAERTLFVAAGISRESLNTVVDLRPR